MEYNPEEIPGPWRAGFALDRHTIRSEYVGDDAYGNPVYETIRSPLGELLFKLKYRGDQSALGPIVHTAAEFVRSWNRGIELLVPVPSSTRFFDRKGSGS